MKKLYKICKSVQEIRFTLSSYSRSIGFFSFFRSRPEGKTLRSIPTADLTSAEAYGTWFNEIGLRLPCFFVAQVPRAVACEDGGHGGWRYSYAHLLFYAQKCLTREPLSPSRGEGARGLPVIENPCGIAPIHGTSRRLLAIIKDESKPAAPRQRIK